MKNKKIEDGFKMEHKISLKKFKDKEVGVLTDVGFFSNAKNHYIERPNPLNEKIIFFCVDGKGYIETDTKISLKKNELYILSKEIEHKYFSSNERPWSIYWAHFKEGSNNFLISGKKYKLENSELILLIKILFQNIIETLEVDLNFENIEYSEKSFKYMMESLNYYLNSSYNEKKVTKVVNYVTEISKIALYINENIDKKITRKDLCDFLFCSNSHLNVIFNKELNISPMHYINIKKIDYSMILLRSTTLSISEVSQKVGFENPLYFSKVFKKRVKCSPRTYRNSLKIT